MQTLLVDYSTDELMIEPINRRSIIELIGLGYVYSILLPKKLLIKNPVNNEEFYEESKIVPVFIPYKTGNFSNQPDIPEMANKAQINIESFKIPDFKELLKYSKAIFFSDKNNKPIGYIREVLTPLQQVKHKATGEILTMPQKTFYKLSFTGGFKKRVEQNGVYYIEEVYGKEIDNSNTKVLIEFRKIEKVKQKRRSNNIEKEE